VNRTSITPLPLQICWRIWGADAETIIAALLHDTVEDTSLTLDEIKAQFGETVYILIDGVTKLSKADMGESPTLNEQIETIRKMFTLMQKDISIMVIKLVDRLHNMETVEFLPPSKQIALDG
jgi:GTP pyrophosphokinase